MTFHFKTFLTATALTAGLAACSGTGGVPAASGGDFNRVVEIANETNRVVFRFYGSNVSRASWEEDVLGASTIPPGGTFMVNFDDGSGYCEFDFRAVFSDGGEVITNGINVCEVATYTIR